MGSMLDGVSLTFRESMSGAVADRPLSFDVTIGIPDLAAFLNLPEHQAQLSGTVSAVDLGGTFAIRDGGFQLFVVDAATGL